MFVIIEGGVIYFEVFKDQKLRKMIYNDNLVTKFTLETLKLNVLAKMLSIKLALLRCVG